MHQSADTPKPARPLPPLLTLTEAAAAHLRALYAGGDGRLLRLSLAARGCSGMSYALDFVAAPDATDELVIDRGVRLLVDRRATLFLVGTVMDWRQDALSSGFTFANPNEAGRCGCGESFHV
jgi:iron-sulfur cluster assembly protein